MNAVTRWATLFLQANSPGAVFRFLERRRLPNPPEFLYLSDAAGNDGWRAMPGEREFLTAQAPFLSRPFPPSVYLLYREEARWGWGLWENGEKKEEFEEDLPQRAPARWKTLLGLPQPLTPSGQWAIGRGLPLARVPGAVPGVKPVPFIEYRTVAVLDQRDLLVETSPRLYRFPLQ